MTGLPGERLRDKIAAVICPGDYCESHSECLRDADFVMPLVTDYVRERAAELLALARGVTALAEDLGSYVAARGTPATGTYDDGLNRAQAAVAADLRRLLADAAPDTGQETP